MKLGEHGWGNWMTGLSSFELGWDAIHLERAIVPFRERHIRASVYKIRGEINFGMFSISVIRSVGRKKANVELSRMTDSSINKAMATPSYYYLTNENYRWDFLLESFLFSLSLFVRFHSGRIRIVSRVSSVTRVRFRPIAAGRLLSQHTHTRWSIY